MFSPLSRDPAAARTTPTTTSSPSAQPTIAKPWDQCGGQGYTGPTRCQDSVCIYFDQCKKCPSTYHSLPQLTAQSTPNVNQPLAAATSLLRTHPRRQPPRHLQASLLLSRRRARAAPFLETITHRRQASGRLRLVRGLSRLFRPSCNYMISAVV
jgi:hypothetical protein